MSDAPMPERGRGAIARLRRLLAPAVIVLRRFAGPIRLILLIAVVAFAVYALASSWDEVERALVQMGPARIVWSVVILVASIAGHYLSWLAVLSALGAPRMPVGASAAISTTSQIAKYVPGSVWTAVVQADLGRRHGVPRRVMLASYGLVLFVSVATGSILSLLVLLGPAPTWVRLLAIVAAVCGAVLLASLFHPRLLHSLLGMVFRRLSSEGVPAHVDRRSLACAILAVAFAWMLAGVQAWILAEPLGAEGADVLFVSGAIVLSWVVGLVIVVLPAGAGARELVLVLTLGQVVGGPEALTIAILTRFLQIAAELGLAAVFGLPYANRALRSRRRGRAAD